MEVSPEIRHKLVLVIGDLLCRCMEKASKVPYVLDREQVVDLLMENPEFFAELVTEEHRDRSEYSHDRVTAKIDAFAELSQLEAMDAFDLSLDGTLSSDAALAPVLEKVNHLTRIFAVYIGNLVAIFEKEFQLFAEKLHRSLENAGLKPEMIVLSPEDMACLEDMAVSFLNQGRFLQAFSFSRLLNSDMIAEELISLQAAGDAINRRLIKGAMNRPELRDSLMVFLLRASYVSQGSWQDLFIMLVELANEEPERADRKTLADIIERDGVFCCNLLCESFVNLKNWPPADRRSAIEAKISIQHPHHEPSL
jgi:hypothetical protein